MMNECVEELKKNVMGEVSEVWLGGCRREMLRDYFNAFNNDNIVIPKKDLDKVIEYKKRALKRYSQFNVCRDSVAGNGVDYGVKSDRDLRLRLEENISLLESLRDGKLGRR